MSDTSQGPGWWMASDGKWYPPQSPSVAQPPPPVALPPKKGLNGCLKSVLIGGAAVVVLGGLAVGCLAVLADEAVEEIERQTGEADPADYDLELAPCEVDQFGFVATSGTITNTSPETQGFEIEVTAFEGDVRIGEQPHFEDALDPGQSASFDMTVIEASVEEGAAVRCEVAVNYSFFDE